MFNTPLTYPPSFYDLPWIYCSTAPESHLKSLNAVALILTLRNATKNGHLQDLSMQAMLRVFKCL